MKLNNFFNDRLMRAPDGVTPAPAPEPTPTPSPEAVDLSFIPADFQADGKPDISAFSAHYQDLVARDAQAAERAGQIPEAYDFATSEGLKFDGLDLPEGFSVQLAKDDPAMSPLFDELGAFLKEVGAPAAAASKVSDLIARYEAVKYSQAYAANKAEMQALGTPAQQEARLSAVDRALQSRLPADQVTALKAAVTSAAGVKALEALLRPAGHTTPAPQPPKPDTDNMSPMERLRFANSKT